MQLNQVLLCCALVVIAAGAKNFSDPSTNLNCQKRPRKLIKTAKSCCEVPTPHFESFTEKCPFLGNANATIYCQLECLFNASEVLEAQNLNLAKLHRLLDQVFPGSVDFVAAYYISYEECISLVKSALKNRRGIKHKCAPTAMLYAACAQMKLLKHCPVKAWNGTEICQKARAYVTRCADNLLPFRKRSSPIRLEEKNQLKSENENLDNATLASKIDETTEAPQRKSLNQSETVNEVTF